MELETELADQTELRTENADESELGANEQPPRAPTCIVELRLRSG